MADAGEIHEKHRLHVASVDKRFAEMDARLKKLEVNATHMDNPPAAPHIDPKVAKCPVAGYDISMPHPSHPHMAPGPVHVENKKDDGPNGA